MELPSNYFNLFGLEPVFDIDLSILEQKFRALQSEYHPDRAAHKDNQSQLAAVHAATFINEAFQVLKSPVKRAQYLLSLRGVETSEEARKQLPPMFLMQQMEMREALAEARDAEDPFGVLENLESEARSLVGSELEAFQVALDSDQLELAEESVRKLQFLVKLQAEVVLAEEYLDEEF